VRSWLTVATPAALRCHVDRREGKKGKKEKEGGKDS